MKDYKEQLVKDMINKQFGIAGHDMTYDKLIELGLNVEQENSNDNWYVKYTITENKAEEFKQWAINEMMERLNISRSEANYEFAWWDLNFGLKVVYESHTSEEKNEEV